MRPAVIIGEGSIASAVKNQFLSLHPHYLVVYLMPNQELPETAHNVTPDAHGAQGGTQQVTLRSENNDTPKPSGIWKGHTRIDTCKVVVVAKYR